MNKLTLKDLPVRDKKVLMRVDFNIPLSKNGEIEDDTRIREALPSIQHVLKQGGSVILMSHLGRPKGKRDEKFSLKVCLSALSKLLNKSVLFASDCIGPDAEKMAKSLKNGEVLLLENLRFYDAEENPEKDPNFAKKLSRLGDMYVNDAFGTAHRAHSSTHTITQYFPKKSAMGFLMQKELSFLEPLLHNPKHPFFAIIGGAKVSSKIGVLKSLLSKVDALFIGGGMAYTFFKAQGISIGKSICEDDQIQTAKELISLCSNKKIPLYLPKDIVITNEVKEGSQIKTISIQSGIPEGWEGVDMGPETVKEWTSQFQKAQTIFWNGPVGVFEISTFAKGTESLASALSQLSSTRIVGGGDSVSAINGLKLGPKFTHLSTGGGAALELLEFGTLPGIEALSNERN